MKRADGGFRPAYNVQYGAVVDEMDGPCTIVGVRVTNIGSDLGSLVPVGGGGGRHPPCGARGDPGADGVRRPAAGRSAPIAAWWAPMGREEREIERQRGGLSEFANARQKGSQRVTQVRVRGASKVFNVMVLGALSARLPQHAASVLG